MVGQGWVGHHRVLEMKLYGKLMAVLYVASSVCAVAQQYGLDSRAPIGAFLNGNLPGAITSASGPWQVVTAFPGLQYAFTDPTFICAAPRDTNRLYVSCRQGKIFFFTNSVTTSNATVFLDLTASTQGWGDCGLLGFAFHPEFGLAGSTNRGYIYVWRSYSATPTTSNPPVDMPTFNRLSRFRLADDATSIDPSTEVVLVNQYDRNVWHNGGAMFFGDDGFLYFSNGDEGGDNDSFNNSQQLNGGLFSGVFRIDVNKDPTKSHPIRRQPLSGGSGSPASSTGNYYIPNDNPFVDSSGGTLEEYWALGLRSPHRMVEDFVTGKIWLGDVGEITREEIDIIQRGGNYQWAYEEGTYNGPKPKPSPVIGIENGPIYEYQHSNHNSCAIGGYVYRGALHPDLYGQYIFGDNTSGRIWAMACDFTNPPVVTELATLPSGSTDYTGLSSFGLDSNNELYMCRMGGPGEILKLIRTTVTNQPPALLSQTGAFSSLPGLTPTAGLIPFDVNVPFWSNGANKRRWVALPNDGSSYATNEQIGFSPTGEWTFPMGTVFIKHFTIQTNDTDPNSIRRLETRFLVLDTNRSVYGVTYKWRTDQTDADLLVSNLTEMITVITASGTRTQPYYYPSQDDCLRCHNVNANFVLGVNTRQLNCSFTYPATGRADNELRTWNHLGMFNPALNETNIPTYAQLSTTNTSLPLYHRARSYLDANCAFCHRPGGVSRAAWDGRFDTPLTNQNIINAIPLNNLGIAGARVILPGSIAQSEMRVRINALDTNAMPPLAKTIIDTNGVALIDSWILSLTNPPAFSLGEDVSSAFLQVHGEAGMVYNLQGTADFNTWTQISTMADSDVRRVPETNSPALFYRLQFAP
jgi:uncharacterized repeat protein (TIGR03806 family)